MKSFFVIGFLVAIIFLIVPTHATQAATLYFRMAKTSYKSGESGFATLNVDTAGKAINAIEATISFDPNLVEISNITTDKTIINMWIQSATLDTTGSITMKGVVFNPGFNGDPGRIIGFDFKAKTTGTFSFNVVSKTVLANDGKGSVIKTSITPTTIIIAGPTPKIIGTGLSITSSSHPDQSKWYAKSTALISWKITDKNVAAVAYTFDQNASTDPGTKSVTTALSAKQTNLSSGVWYAHLRGKTTKGTWAATEHFKIQVDVDPPRVDTITVLPRLDESFLPVIRLKALDDQSGVANYEIFVNGVSIDQGPSFIDYKLKNLNTGKNTIKVKATDNVGNVRSDTFSVLYNPLPGTKPVPEVQKVLPAAKPTAPTTPKSTTTKIPNVIPQSTKPKTPVVVPKKPVKKAPVTPVKPKLIIPKNTTSQFN